MMENKELMAEARASLSGNWGLAVGTFLVYIIIVGSIQLIPTIGDVLFLFIAGIIAAIAYSQTFYILAEDDTIGSMEALRKSKEMMNGYKWKYFCLGLRFIGWVLVCVLTLGIGVLWLSPYIQVSYAKFYEDLKTNQAVSES